jgi:hypothetical protein
MHRTKLLCANQAIALCHVGCAAARPTFPKRAALLLTLYEQAGRYVETNDTQRRATHQLTAPPRLQPAPQTQRGETNVLQGKMPDVGGPTEEHIRYGSFLLSPGLALGGAV